MTPFPLAPPEALADLALTEAPGVAALVFARERPQDGPLVDDLVDRAFGPGRFAKTAERLRETNNLRHDLSVCAWDGERLVGAARQWPVWVGETRALFLGPFAVDPAWRRRGLGGALIEHAAALAREAGERLTLLVGDAPYFAPFGYVQVPWGRIALPGPVDAARVLWRPLGEDALEGVGGAVRPPREDE